MAERKWKITCLGSNNDSFTHWVALNEERGRSFKEVYTKPPSKDE